MGTNKHGNALKARLTYLALYPACLAFGLLAILLNIREDGQINDDPVGSGSDINGA